MMQKNYRIKKSSEIEQVMKNGRSKANPYFIVYKYILIKKISHAYKTNAVINKQTMKTSELQSQLEKKSEMR